MTCNELKRIPLTSILQYLQIPCARINSREAWLKNPFDGGNEKTASTKVDIHRNIWYSHSEAIGGNNIDFLMKFLGTTDLKDILNWADERKNILSLHQQTNLDIRHSSSNGANEPGYSILSIKPLANKALLDYLSKDRRIDLDIAREFCAEIYYQTANGRTCFAVCFLNDSGGYELRNSYDKRSLQKKDITTMSNGYSGVALFEGFIDFLSFMTLQKRACLPYRNRDYCILNTTVNLQKSYLFLELHKSITSYLDTDRTGVRAYENLDLHFGKTHRVTNGMQELKSFSKDIKDVNDYLIYGQTDMQINKGPATNRVSNR